VLKFPTGNVNNK